MAFFDTLLSICGLRPSGASPIVVVPVAEGPSGNPGALTRSAAGLHVSVAEAVLPTGAATEAKQDAGNSSLASIAETTHVVAVTATTYTTPLKWIHNYGAAGTCKIKSNWADTAQTIYLAQGATLANAEIVAVSDIGVGVTMTGGY